MFGSFDFAILWANAPFLWNGMLLTLQLMFCLGPASLALLAAWIISGYRLDAASHEDVRRRLAEKDLEHQPPILP